MYTIEERLPDENSTRTSSQARAIHVAEEGEAMGTLQQFAHHLNRSREGLLRCAERNAQTIILNPGEGADRILIVDADQIEALRRCAGSAPLDASSDEAPSRNERPRD